MPEFLDLVHRHLLLLTEKPEDRRRLNQQLGGPPRISGPSLVDARAGFVPPVWWRGDEYASRSSVTAMLALKR